MNPQDTDEWLQDRCGVITASRFADVLAKIRTGEAAARANYKAEIVTERLTGKPTESFTTAPMQWGKDKEAEARMVYEAINNVTVELTGLIKMPGLEAGASPDGLVGSDGIIEIKCPNSATYIGYLMNMEKAVKKYYAQIQGQLSVTGREWCDFIIYDPRFPDHLAYRCVRVPRDVDYIAVLNAELVLFDDEVNEIITKLEAL